MKHKTLEGIIENGDRYIIEDTGHIFDIFKNAYVKQHRHPKGYRLINLCTSDTLSETNGRTMCTVHSLMVRAFYGAKLESGHIVCNHINEIRHDNRLCNLEVVTQSENIKHSLNLRKQGIPRPLLK